MERTSPQGSVGPSGTCPMVKEAGDLCPHVLQNVITAVGRGWAIMVLGTLGNFGTLRFHELAAKLGSISPKTLSARLKELEAAGFVQRRSFAEVPPRVEYSLTVEGRGLVRAIQPLIRWADRVAHVPRRVGRPRP